MKSPHSPPEFRESKSQEKRMFEHTRPRNELGQMENRCPGTRNEGRSSSNHLESILRLKTNHKSQKIPKTHKITEFPSLLSRDTGAVCRSEGYPRTGYFTPGCVRGMDLAREPVVLSRRRRRRCPPARLLVDGLPSFANGV